ncbi:MAG: HD domain-containing protein [Ruminococcus sp.]|nr:HD domain-containing protein [Ruminococcus sp.]
MGCPHENFEYHDLIECITTAVDVRDPYTGEHSLRVGDMALLLCQSLGLSEEETNIIHIAGHVHDIGKIGVPDTILLKNGCLNSYEWDLVKKHPKIGADILSKSDKLTDIANLVLHHHERYDGEGYPSGLKGEDIPLGARIIAVCDSIDAMSSERAYRSAMPLEVVRMEIHNNIGTMYDPDIAIIALKEWENILKLYE